MFKKKKPQPVTEFDPSRYEPVIRCSICTGEQTAGFKDKETGTFLEVMLIRNDRDLDSFKTMYHVQEVRKIY